MPSICCAAKTEPRSERLQQTANLVGAGIDSYLRSGTERLAQVAALPELREDLATNRPAAAPLPETVVRALEDWFFMSRVCVGGVMLVGDSEEVLWSEPATLRTTPLSRAQVQVLDDAKRGGGALVSSGVPPSAVVSSPHVTLVQPIFGKDGRAIAHLVGFVDLMWAAFLDVLNVTARADDRFVVTDQKGQVLASTGDHALLTLWWPPEAVENSVLAATRLARAHWQVRAGQPKETALAGVREWQYRLLGIGSALLLLVVLMGGPFIRSFRDAITRLNHSAEVMAAGDLTQPVRTAPRSDELGTLAETFDRMRSELRQSQDALRARLIERDELLRLKEEFLANTSHELRTPLNVILGYNDMVADLGRNPELEGPIRGIRAQANHLLNLIEDPMTLSGVNSGKLSVHVAPVSLAELGERLATLARRLTANRAITLAFDLDPTVATIETDGHRLEQILSNPVTNACKFTERGRISLRAVRVPDTDLLEFTISDTGIGIPARELPFIFDEFRQVDGSMSRRHGGLGLGLAVTHKLLMLLGGQISVRSVEGEGASFCVRIPLRGGAAGTADPAARHPERAHEPVASEAGQLFGQADPPFRGRPDADSEPRRAGLRGAGHHLACGERRSWRRVCSASRGTLWSRRSVRSRRRSHPLRAVPARDPARVVGIAITERETIAVREATELTGERTAIYRLARHRHDPHASAGRTGIRPTSTQLGVRPRAPSTYDSRVPIMTVYRHVLVIASVVTMGLTGASAAASAQTAPRPRIVNGALSHRPTVGALLTVRPGGFSGSCSGTMIGCQTFLTAAHCVCDGLDFSSCGAIDPSDYKVFLQNVGIVDVSAIDAEPTYDFAQGGDIAVVTLASPIEGVSPMTIHTGSSPAPGTAAQIAGYGITADGRDDSGVLRDGDVETSSCSGIAEPSTHLCWVFAEPFGVPGSNSNTCQGDSGGPLFADLGAGDRLVGVTSGGDVCVGGVSFDAGVSAHSAFITGIAGADLLNTTCGSIAQVGTPGATVTPISYTDIANTKAQRSCRKTIGTAIRTLTSSTLMAQQKCLDGVNRGLLAGPCPDTKASDAILRALAKVTADKLGKKCPADLLAAGVGQEALCTGATTPGSLSTCIANTAATQSDAAVALHYAEDAPSGPIADAGVLACQNGIAKAGLSLLTARLTAESSCAAALDAGKVPTCPDAKASVKLQRAEAKATDTIGGACSDAQIVALDAAGDFGTCGSVTTVAGLVSCLLAGDADISAGTLDVLSLAQLTADATFDVPVGTDLLRITLNGDETAPNDLDLYVRAGGPATPTTYDHASQNAGMWETIEVVSPAAGTWHMHVDLFSGAPSITYQVTATTFEP